MKKIILTLTAVLAAGPAMASKGRLSALGQNVNGSYYIQDHRNIFLNPAAINQVGKLLNFELGSAISNSAPKVATTPNAEGGATYKAGGFNVGVQLGREGMVFDRIDTANSLLGASTFILPQNTIEAIMGKNNWGVSLYYADSAQDTGTPNNKPDEEAHVITVRGGLIEKNFEVNAYLDLMEEAKHEETTTANNRKYNGNFNLGAGGVYRLSNTAEIVGHLDRGDFEIDANGTKTKIKSITVSSEYVMKVQTQKRADIYLAAGLLYSTAKIDYSGATTDVDLDAIAIPVTLTVEAKANSWLTIRASAKQNTFINHQNTTDGTNKVKNLNLESTSVAAGLGIDLGDFQLDGTLAGSTTGVVNANSLLANASLSYSF